MVQMMPQHLFDQLVALVDRAAQQDQIRRKQRGDVHNSRRPGLGRPVQQRVNIQVKFRCSFFQQRKREIVAALLFQKPLQLRSQAPVQQIPCLGKHRAQAGLPL